MKLLLLLLLLFTIPTLAQTNKSSTCNPKNINLRGLKIGDSFKIAPALLGNSSGDLDKFGTHIKNPTAKGFENISRVSTFAFEEKVYGMIVDYKTIAGIKWSSVREFIDYLAPTWDIPKTGWVLKSSLEAERVCGNIEIRVTTSPEQIMLTDWVVEDKVEAQIEKRELEKKKAFKP